MPDQDVDLSAGMVPDQPQAANQGGIDLSAGMVPDPDISTGLQPQQGPVNPYANPPQESALHSAGRFFGITPEQIAAKQQDEQAHPIRTAIERYVPGAQLLPFLRGTAQGAQRSIGELTQAGEAIEDNNPAAVAVHGIQAIPIIGSGIKTGSEQLQPGQFINPAEAVTALGTGVQAASMLGGGGEVARGLSESGVWIPREPRMLPPPEGEILPPEAPPAAGGGGGPRPVAPEQGGGGGGVATAVRTQVKTPTLTPEQAIREAPKPPEQLRGGLPQEIIDLQRRATAAQRAARQARVEVANRPTLTDPDPAAVQNANILQKMADDLSATAQRATSAAEQARAAFTAKWKGLEPPAGNSPQMVPVPTPAQIGAQYVQHVLNGVPPAVAAAGLGMTTQHQEAAHVAYAFVPQSVATLAGSQTPPAPPAAVSAPPPAPPSAVSVQQQAQQNTVVEAAASAQTINKAATGIALGIPPPKPPQIPQPEGMADGHLSQQTVDTTGQVISSLPPPMQPKAVLEATGNLAKWLFSQKTAIGPDGKVVNVDSQKAAQTVAVGIINAEVDRQAEQAKVAQDARQTAIEERQESAKQAQEERDEAIAPAGEKTAEKSTVSTEPVEIPDTPSTRKAAMVLSGAPMDATSEQLDALIRRTATVTSSVRKRLVEDEVRRRANRQEDQAQAGMMGAPAAPGQSREELQRWADAVGRGEHPYLHVPAGSDFKPAGVDGLTKTPVKSAGPFSGTYYHVPGFDGAIIRKAARDKTNPQGALDAIVSQWSGGKPAAEQKPVELKAEDVEPETSNQVAKQEVPSESKEVTSKPEGKALTLASVKRANPPQVAQPTKMGPVEFYNATGGDARVLLKGTEYLFPGFEEYHIALVKPRGSIAAHDKLGWESFEVSTGRRLYGEPHQNSTEQRTIAGTLQQLQVHGKAKLDAAIEQGLKSPQQKSTVRAEEEVEPTVKVTKARIIPTREGIKVEPVTLPPEASTGLTALVDDHASTDPTATLDDVLRDKDAGNLIAEALVNDGIITNSAENVNPKTGLLTTSAKAKVGDALLGELLPPEVIEQTPDFVKQKLLGTMGAVKGIIGAGDGWNLQEQIVAATERYNELFRQDESQDRGPVVEAIVKKLDEPIDKVRAAFSSFAVAATNHDPSDKPFFDFNLAFGTELTEEQYAAGLKPVEKPVEEEAGPARPGGWFVYRTSPRAQAGGPWYWIVKNPQGEFLSENFPSQEAADEFVRSQSSTPISASETPAAAPKPLAKGDKVTYRTNKGKERSGEVAWTDGKKVRVTDNGSTVNKSIEDVKPVESPAEPVFDKKRDDELTAEARDLQRRNDALAGVIKKPAGSFTPPAMTAELNQTRGAEMDRNEQRLAEIAEEKRALVKASESKPEPAKKTHGTSLVDYLQNAFENGRAPKNYNDLKNLVELYDRQEPDQIRMKEGQEAYEAMLNRAGRDIVARTEGYGHSLTNEQAFNKLVSLYEGQPNLSIRTSTSIANQAYSTPLPLAFIADRFAGIDRDTTVYEPTAGNGALLIAANPEKVLANELNPARAQTLEDEGFHVLREDATIWSPVTRMDAVVANPPFGPLAGPVKVDGYNVVKLDHLIVAKALGAMKDAGRAAVIIAAGDREKPGEITNQVRPFFNWLYAHYNVVSDFELDGDLYSRQGASYPVRLIAIDGRVRSAKVSPDAAAIQRLKTWGEVYDKAAEHLGTNLEGQRPANNELGGPVRVESSDEGAVPGTATGLNRPSDSSQPNASRAGYGSDGGTELRPGPVAHSGRLTSPGVGSTDSTVRPDGDVARSDRLAEGQPAPRAVRREPAEPDGHSANALADESNQFQSSYHPKSSKQDTAVMAPKALIEPMQGAMDRIQEEVGDIDSWVTDQLGYPDVETLHEAFMGIQTDAIATAIYQMQRNKAVIVGDQTGVGKGRVAAAMIRWAELHGHIPVFVTESAPLFSPMWADIQDIGSEQTISPLLFNTDASITDSKTGLKIFQNPGAMRPVLDRIRETGELPMGRNAIFLTYSQINTDNRQQLTLSRIAPNAIFILDESHNAGGDSNTGNFLSELVTNSKGVTFLSATWAKRPDNLPLYAGMTDISIAIPDRALVASAIQAGGAPLQAVLTSLLAQTGQFVRRERSFDGIDIRNQVDEKNEAEHTRISDKVTEVLRGIVKADSLFHNLDFERIQAQAKKAGGGAQSNKVVVQHMEFSSGVHNLVKQLLLALKADDAANQIIASIERGEKPVFALENTMGAFLDSYIQGHNLHEGDSLAGLTYSRISDRALMRTRYYNETDQMGNKTRIEVPLDDLSPAVRQAYDECQALIDSLNVDLPVSPIDYIRDKVEKAGYKIAEITGRGARIDYSGEAPKLGTVPGIERKDRVNTATQFNNGGLDALIINRAGSSGISLHSGEKFRDQRKRHMIVGQPAGDVNIVMQILGRINRTGQMVLPKYTMLAAALPAEQRPAINLAKKMKSLNANVSSNTRAATSVQAVDLMNKYGDRIVAQYLEDNPEMERVLGLKAKSKESGEAGANEGLAMKATGHSALLPVAQQQEFMDSITEAYTNYIDFLDETGQNDLEPRTYDYAARETHIERMYQGVDPSSPFGQDAHYGEYSIKRQGKPFTPEEVMEKIAETFGPEVMKLSPRERDTLAARDLAHHMEELYKPYFEGIVHEGSLERAQQMRTRGRQLLNDYRVGTGLRLEINGEQYNGVVTNIEGAKKPSGNPYAPSSLQFTIAVNSGLRQTKVPGSQMDAIVTSNLGRNADVRQLFKDYGSDRQKAKIITGNLLGAYGELATGVKGRIISFTMDDGTSKLGILMPSKFDIKEDVSGTYALRTPEGALSFLQTGDAYLQSSGSEIGVFGPTNRREETEIRTKTSKAAAGKFFLDPKLLDAVQGGEFASSGGLMKATVKEGRELDALKAIMGKIALYANPSHVDEARTHDEKAKAELDNPKRSKLKKLLKSEEGSITFANLASAGRYAKKVASVTVMDDIIKPLSKTVAGAGYEIAATFFPVVLADYKTLNIMDRAVGSVALDMFQATNALDGLSKMFDNMPEDEQTEFVDRIQNLKNPNYKEQSTPDLQKAMEMFDAINEAALSAAETAVNLGRTPDSKITFPRKSSYFPNRWERNHRPTKNGVELDEEEKEIEQIASIWNNATIGRRPLAPKNFLKKQSWTQKEGIEHGGKPIGNPAVQELRSLEEKVKFATAHEMKYQARQAGLLKFRRRGDPLQPNFARVPDPLMKVWRLVDTAEGGSVPVENGEWVMQKDAARLLNNYLSKDAIRGSSIGTIAMNIKTTSTMAKFGLGVFHYFTIPFWATVTGFQTAGDLLWNQGARGLDAMKALEGTLEVPKSLTGLAADAGNAFISALKLTPKIGDKIPLIPAGAIYKGGQYLKYAKNPDEYLETAEGQRWAESNSDYARFQYLLYVGGLRWGMNEDFRLDGPNGWLTQLKEGHVGQAAWAATKGTLRLIASPLMQHYVPRMKFVVATHLLAMKLDQYSEALAAGTITEETLARQVVTTIEDRFGEVNYGRQYLNNTIKAAVQLAFMAPGWKGGTWDTMIGAMVEAGLSVSQAYDMAGWLTEKITGQAPTGKTYTSPNFDDRMRDRFTGGGSGGGGGRGGGAGGGGNSGGGFGEFSSRLPQIGMRSGAVLATCITAAILSSVLTKLMTGKWPWEFFEEDKKKYALNEAQAAALELAHARIGGEDRNGNALRMTFPTDLRDVEHVIFDLKGYAKGTIAAPWRAGAETLLNRDWRDNYVINPADPLQKQFWQGLTYNFVNDYEPISVDQFSQTPAPGTGVGKRLISATGLLHGMPAAETRSSALNLALSMKPHTPLTPEQQAERDYGREHPTEGSIRWAARNKDLDYLERVFKGLSYTDAKAVYDDPKTTAAERAELKPFLDKKRINAIKSARRK